MPHRHQQNIQSEKFILSQLQIEYFYLQPLPPADLFTKKGPDPRFYASKKNLRTPNEMERFRRARNRAFMRNVEQAIPELDFTDHEVKYQPERQLFQVSISPFSLFIGYKLIEYKSLFIYFFCRHLQ